jgi:nucleolar protein TMA23
MDVHAHLLSLGWAGPGHSLDSRPHPQHKGRRGLAYDPAQNNNNTGRGLVKPLLVSQKKNSFGIGKKSHEPAAGNEWWLKGFENALSNVGKNSGSQATSGTATPESADAATHRGKHIGLYGFFVKGQQMEGTIREKEERQSRGKKRKSDTFDDEEDGLTSSDVSIPDRSILDKKAEPKSESEASTDFAQISQFLDIRDKDRKRTERRTKAHPAQEFEQIGHLFETGSKSKQKHPRSNTDADMSNAIPETDRASEGEPKDERRRRRKEAKSHNSSEPVDLSEKEHRRQERRAAKAAASSNSSETEIALLTLIGSKQVRSPQADSSTAAAEALSRAERKRRKGQKQMGKLEVNSLS